MIIKENKGWAQGMMPHQVGKYGTILLTALVVDVRTVKNYLKRLCADQKACI